MNQRLQTIAAAVIFISALLHLAAPIFSGFASESLPLLVFFVLYSALAWLVYKNRRWAIWLSFFFMLFGGIAGMAGYMDIGSAIPSWISLGIWVADWVAAVCLLLILWRDHAPVTVAAD